MYSVFNISHGKQCYNFSFSSTLQFKYIKYYKHIIKRKVAFFSLSLKNLKSNFFILCVIVGNCVSSCAGVCHRFSLCLGHCVFLCVIVCVIVWLGFEPQLLYWFIILVTIFRFHTRETIYLQIYICIIFEKIEHKVFNNQII